MVAVIWMTVQYNDTFFLSNKKAQSKKRSFILSINIFVSIKEKKSDIIS